MQEGGRPKRDTMHGPSAFVLGVLHAYAAGGRRGTTTGITGGWWDVRGVTHEPRGERIEGSLARGRRVDSKPHTTTSSEQHDRGTGQAGKGEGRGARDCCLVGYMVWRGRGAGGAVRCGGMVVSQGVCCILWMRYGGHGDGGFHGMMRCGGHKRRSPGAGSKGRGRGGAR
jgi:hypothetical protein